MNVEAPPVILLAGSPQTSRSPELPETDLLAVDTYRGVVNAFDSALGLPENGSLHPDRQIASVVHSVASQKVFLTALNDRLAPGTISLDNRYYYLRYVGHSVGEMSGLVIAGIYDIPAMAWILQERERITEDPARAGFRMMVAATGVDPDKLQEHFGHLKDRLAGTADVFLANINTPKQVVLSLKIMKGKADDIVASLPGHISGLIDPDTDQPLFSRVKVIVLKLSNAFHSAEMKVEEDMLNNVTDSRLGEQYFRSQDKGVIYSPMLDRWINSPDDVIDLMKHQLTKQVKYTNAMKKVAKIPGLRVIVAADIVGTTPKMIKDNIGDVVPIVNIKDIDSLNQAVETTVESIRKVV